MKTLAITLATIGVLATALYWLVSDRDRGMWLMNTAMRIANKHRVVADLEFGSNDWQKLDVYPAQNSKSAPVVVFLHGGSWRHGRKDQYFFAADAFLRLGYTVVLPDYIKHPSPEARYPAFIEDGAQAITWVKANIREYNGDPDNIFLAGHSAGAHTAAMLATDGRFLNKVGLSEKDLKGVAGIAGPYSFIPDWYVTQEIFGPPENYPLMDALNYVDGSEPSTLLLHSSADEQVGQYNQKKLARSLKEKGADVETKLYRGVNHIDMVLHLHPWWSKDFNIASDIDAFFKKRMTSN
jgi:acetyl esterase/lipase